MKDHQILVTKRLWLLSGLPGIPYSYLFTISLDDRCGHDPHGNAGSFVSILRPGKSTVRQWNRKLQAIQPSLGKCRRKKGELCDFIRHNLD